MKPKYSSQGSNIARNGIIAIYLANSGSSFLQISGRFSNLYTNLPEHNNLIVLIALAI